MQKTDLVGFRATPAERQKLEALAAGERCSVSEVLRRLVAQTPVVEVNITGFMFASKNGKTAQGCTATGGFAN